MTRRGEVPERAKDGDVGALVGHHHGEHGHEIERRHRHDQHEDHRHHGLLDADGAEITGVIHGPVADLKARRQRLRERGGIVACAERIDEIHVQRHARIRVRQQRAHVVDGGDQQFAVVVLHGRIEHAGHVEFTQARLGHAVRVGGGNQHGDRIAESEPEHLRDATPDDDAIGCRESGRRDFLRRWIWRSARLRASWPGSMPRRRTGNMSGLRTASASSSMNGAAPVTCGARRTVSARAFQSGVPLGLRQERKCAHARRATQPVAQLAFQTVHHRENDDERRHPQAHAQQRHPGDEGDEELVGAGPHVAQADKQGQGIQH